MTADPQNPAIVYTGSQRVFQSQNFGDSWVDISPDLTTFDTTGTLVFGTITFIDVSPLNSDIIYAGTDDGKVWNTLNGGTSWTQINNGLPVRWVTCVETDPFDQATAYVTISGYRFHDVMSHVYKTTNNGLTWTDIGSTLPDIPCNNILADPTIPDLLYLATDVGVYFTNNSGNDWFPVADGMPIVVCTDLKIHNPTRTLVVGTYGRSSYKIDLNDFVGLAKNQKFSKDISIFPNPIINGLATLEFSLLQKDDISVSVFSLAGKTLSKQSLKGQMGKNIYPLDFKNASPGVYMVSLKIGDERVNKKVVVN